MVGIIANLLGAAVLDRLGRKPLLLFGLVGCCICLSLEAAMVSLFAEAGTNKAGLQMGVAASYLFLFVYSMGIDVSYSDYSQMFSIFKSIVMSLPTLPTLHTFEQD